MDFAREPENLAVLSIGLLGFISVWGLTFPVLNTSVTGVEVEVSGQYYNLWSYPIVLGVLLILGFYMDYDVEGRRRALISLGIFSLSTVLAALIAPSETWTLSNVDGSDALLYRLVGNASALSILPPAAYVCLTVIKRTLEFVPGNPNRNYQLKQVGITMIHVAFALFVVTVTFSYLFTAQSSLVVADADREATIEGSTVHEVPDSNYAVQVSDYRSSAARRAERRKHGTLERADRLPRTQEIHETRQPVYGTATQINTGPNATVIQLDNSGIWIGAMNASQTELGIEREIRSSVSAPSCGISCQTCHSPTVSSSPRRQTSARSRTHRPHSTRRVSRELQSDSPSTRTASRSPAVTPARNSTASRVGWRSATYSSTVA